MTHAGFRHEVLFYRDDDEFLAGVVPFLRGALEAGARAVAAVPGARIEMLEGELGEDGELVRFADMEQVGRNPARIIPFWQAFLDEHGAGDGPVRGIGEPVWPQRTPDEVEECRLHEWLLSFAFDGGRAWSLLCPYDSGALADAVLEEAARTHSGVGSPPPPFAGTLSTPPPAAEALDFDRATLREVRLLVAERARHAGLQAPRVGDLVSAASEVAANSILHGGGRGRLSLWVEDGRLLVEAEDRGLIDEPLVGRVRPTVTQDGGRGLWLANHLCDLVQIRSGPEGTNVRLQMSLS
jgi:anti-sigma regulatory factor (Ser/Thr protein kinase)